MSTRPTENMLLFLDRIAREDVDLGDPTMMDPHLGRALVALTSERWNENLPDVAESRTIMHDSKPALWIVPHDDNGSDAIFYVHGGGWSLCSPTTHASVARRLAIACQCPVLAPSYRLAPENPWPAGLEDVLSAFSACGAERRWSVAGDSAGANLAMAAMLKLLEREDSLPVSALLFQGVYNADFETESYLRYSGVPGFSREKMMRFWDRYVPVSNRSHFSVSPFLASDAMLRALPPMYFNASSLDPLLCDTERLVVRLHSLGRDDIYHRIEGVIHGFMQTGNSLPEARDAFEHAGVAFRSITGEPEPSK